MLSRILVAAGLGLALTATATAQTPRQGGTIRMTAPYGSSFSSMDIHTTQRAQDEIFAKGLHRSLYIWDSAKGEPVLELAKQVTVSDDGLVHTFKLRDDAFFHHGRKMTADDIIWTYNRIMDGTKAYPGARFVRLIKGASEVEKGQAKEISGLKKVDDFTLQMALTEKVNPGFYFFTATTSIYPADEGAKESFVQKPIGLGPFKFVEHVPGSRIVLEKWEKFYKTGKPYADKFVVSIMSEAAARDVAFRNKEDRYLGAGARPVRRLSGRPQPERDRRRGARGVHPPHGHEPELQAVLRQARAAGDQLRHRRPADHRQAGQGQGLSRHQLAADHLAGLRQGVEALCVRSGEGQAAACRGGLSQRLRVRMDHQRQRKLGLADRRGGHPDARPGRHQGEGQADRDGGAGRDGAQGRVPGLHLFAGHGTRSAGGA